MHLSMHDKTNYKPLWIWMIRRGFVKDFKLNWMIDYYFQIIDNQIFVIIEFIKSFLYWFEFLFRNFPLISDITEIISEKKSYIDYFILEHNPKC
jgi:hypothetical protein